MDLFNMLSSVVGNPNNVSQMSQQLGAQPDQTSQALQAALPMLLGAMARNAKSPEGASALAGALDRDHDGSILNDVSGFMGMAEQGPGNGILNHVLGDKRPMAEQAVAQKSGMDIGQVAKMFTTVAPLVMGFLGQQKRQNNLDANGLGALLGSTSQQVEQQQGNSLGFIGNLLDRDGDGDVMDDVMGMLGGMFGGKK
jgi:hypothetical protein